MKKTTLLCILDGWGHREETEYNAIASANTPNWDRMSKSYPKSFLHASGLNVGLPDGQMGNSEVGHMNIGCGRIMLQLLPRINTAITEGNLKDRGALQKFVSDLKKSGGACHLLGLASDGGVHGHIDHVIYLAKVMADEGIRTYIHAFLDGRDAAPRSAAGYVERLEAEISDYDGVSLATICGRYYGMDRDNNWDRVAQNYHAIAKSEGVKANNLLDAIKACYAVDKTDEFIKPHILPSYAGVKDGDGFFMSNYRADRAREITRAFLEEGFSEFPREQINFSTSLGMAEYSTEITEYLPSIFSKEIPSSTLADILERENKTQLHIAETEKYAHVTFFFNGGAEEEKQGEKRILVPSPKVKTYDMQPEMSAEEVLSKLTAALQSGEYDFIVVNFANPDMVGHTGVWEAALSAVEQIDKSIGQLEKTILDLDGNMMITADHGNIEYMYEKSSNQPHTAHTTNVVPFVLINKGAEFNLLDGKLCDIAPTILELMQINQPSEMTGKSLIKK